MIPPWPFERRGFFRARFHIREASACDGCDLHGGRRRRLWCHGRPRIYHPSLGFVVLWCQATPRGGCGSGHQITTPKLTRYPWGAAGAAGDLACLKRSGGAQSRTSKRSKVGEAPTTSGGDKKKDGKYKLSWCSFGLDTTFKPDGRKCDTCPHKDSDPDPVTLETTGESEQMWWGLNPYPTGKTPGTLCGFCRRVYFCDYRRPGSEER